MPKQPSDHVPTPCMTPSCEGIAQWKGVCSSCYGQAKRLMEENGITWQDLEALGLVKLEHKPFTIAFYKAAKDAV